VYKRERGQNVLFFAAALIPIMMLMALMIDIGGAIITYHKAQIAADSAAFAAAQGIDLKKFYSTQKIELDSAVATGLAGQYAELNSRGQLNIVGVYLSEDQIWVVGQMIYHPFFSGFVGVGKIQITVMSSSVPEFGIDKIQQ
jgi:uncharacterized membrane protein